jgi:hypothetical protein
MICLLRNDQELQVSVHPVMRRKLPPSARGCSPPGHPFCTSVGEIAGLVSDRDATGLFVTFTPKCMSVISMIEAEAGILEG